MGYAHAICHFIATDTGFSYSYFQLAVQDLPEVPASVPEEISDKLDLPDVPTKAPVADAAAEGSSQRKGILFSPNPNPPAPPHPPPPPPTKKKKRRRKSQLMANR